MNHFRRTSVNTLCVEQTIFAFSNFAPFYEQFFYLRNRLPDIGGGYQLPSPKIAESRYASDFGSTECLKKNNTPVIYMSKNLDPFYVVSYYMKWVKTSWHQLMCIRSAFEKSRLLRFQSPGMQQILNWPYVQTISHPPYYMYKKSWPLLCVGFSLRRAV